MEIATQPFGGYRICSILIKKLIELEWVIVKNISQSDKIISIYIEIELKTHKCPQCGKRF